MLSLFLIKLKLFELAVQFIINETRRIAIYSHAFISHNHPHFYRRPRIEQNPLEVDDIFLHISTTCAANNRML